ncbi:MAG: secretin and TonB N-terminal domain-containing protein [Prochloron sp. SP5CPC1]|nr:secretin and TonB N-terminal domain-containing protein [Candidatus Paraprochloron terpiosi SP5CPC1]
MKKYGHDCDSLSQLRRRILTGAALMLLTVEPVIAQSTKVVKVEQPLELAQTSELPTPLIPDPEIIIQDNPRFAGQDNPQPAVGATPPYLPRAVAPPVGDISVSNIHSTPDILDLGTLARVPRLVLREAPVREVLSILARSANLNLIFSDEGEPGNTTVSLDLENESVQDLFNYVLQISGLQANRRGRTLFVGAKLPQSARNLITRTFRLNQASASGVSAFLATQGAAVQQLVTPIEEITDPVTNRVVQRRELPTELRPITANQPEDSTAPLLLRGLTVTTDERNNSLTMVGSPRQIQIATSFLVQMDARRRQVAVNVKVLDVNLDNTDDFSASFSFGVGDGFFVSDGGNTFFNYGGVNPPSQGQAASSLFGPPVIGFDPTGGGATLDNFLDVQDAPFGNINQGNTNQGTPPYTRPSFGTNRNPFQAGVTEIERGTTTTRQIRETLTNPDGTPMEDENGDPITIFRTVTERTPTVFTFEPPSLFQFPTRFLASLEAQVVSGNAKILTDPTLVVQEGQEATVKLVQEVIGSIATDIDTESGVRTVTPVIREAGLNLTVNIEKIDDNGFINFTVSPVVSAVGSTIDFDTGTAGENTLSLLNIRELSSGLIRLRDSQTLILSGIIQESDRTTVSKVPILGDIPLLGALFRSTNRQNQRNEVIVLVTPQIIDDSESSGFGYNYAPGREASQILREQGIQVPGAPR